MKKYNQDISNLKQNRIMNFQIGLIAALGVALLCINYTKDVYEKKDAAFEDVGIWEDPIVIPNTTQEKKIMPPPPNIEEVEPTDLVEDIEFEEEPEPVIENPSPVAQPEKPKLPVVPAKAPTRKEPVVDKNPPVVIAPPVPEEEEDFEPEKFVEIMPRFRMPEDKNASEDEIKSFADLEMIKYISKNIRYPSMAKEIGIEGTVVIRFVVEKDGSITGIENLRDPGSGLGEEAIRVVRNMPKWQRVGRQNGRNVRVYFTLPIKFKLDK